MASLQQVSKTFRHILVIGLLIVVGIFILTTTINIFKNSHPAPPPAPTVSFGKLPTIVFPQSVTTAKLQYNLDTLSGNLPQFPDRATVFVIQQPQPTLLSLNTATTIVGQMGYTGTPIKVSDEYYKWVNTDDLPKTLLFDIYTNNFAITSSFQSDSNIQQAINLPNQNGAISTVTTYLQAATLLPTDIDANKTKATLLSLNNGQLISATSLSKTQIIQVDLFQNDVAGLPIFYPQPTHSTMNLYVAGGVSVPQIVLANFNHQTVSSQKATYPIITAQQALDLLKQGQGYIASYSGTDTTISITNIVLGYYMSDKSQQYLEPVIVFEGSNGFYAYVPAITNAWIHN